MYLKTEMLAYQKRKDVKKKWTELDERTSGGCLSSSLSKPTKILTNFYLQHSLQYHKNYFHSYKLFFVTYMIVKLIVMVSQSK